LPDEIRVSGVSWTKPKGAIAPGYVRPCPSQLDDCKVGAVPTKGFTYLHLSSPLHKKGNDNPVQNSSMERKIFIKNKYNIASR